MKLANYLKNNKVEENQQLPATVYNSMEELTVPLPLAISEQGSLIIQEFRIKCQKFTEVLNRLPPAESIGATPDGNASTILISHIEMTLDEMFFGLWDTMDFRFQQVANEIVGSILLVVTHPVTGKELKRTGAAAIQIMVDATPDDLKYNASDPKEVQAKKKRERNKWALDVENKKPSALDMSFPKLKAECLKNAAQSLGKVFGRDLNRKISDQHKPLLKTTKSEEVLNKTKEAIQAASEKSNNLRAKARTI